MPAFFTFQILVAIVTITLVTIGPFALTWRYARKWTRPRYLLYIPVGFCLGFVGDVLLATFSSNSLPYNDPERLHFWAGFVRFAPWFMSAGCVGGLTFWIVSGRAIPSVNLLRYKRQG